MKLKLGNFKCQKWTKPPNPVIQAHLNIILRFFQFSGWKHLWVSRGLHQYAAINLALPTVISIMEFDGTWTTMYKRI